MTAYHRLGENAQVLPVARKPVMHTQTLRVCLYLSLLLIDVISLCAGPALTWMATLLFGETRNNLVPSLALIPIFLLTALNNGAYSIQALRRPTYGARRAVTAFVGAVFALLVFAFLAKDTEPMSRLMLGVGAIASMILMAMSRLIFGAQVNRATGSRLVKELLIVDGLPMPIVPEGTYVIEASRIPMDPDLGNPAMLNRFGMIAKAFDRIVIHSVPERQADWAMVLKGADVDGEILVDECNSLGAIGLRTFDGKDTMLVSRKPLSLSDRIKKRVLDLAITIPLLIALLPLLLLVALAVKLETRGPVLFRQARVGRGNRQFQVLKFRSMRVEQCDADGVRSASRTDDRITRVGRVIRATSIDELPQLINVLLGDMSLVGPRPHALGSLAGDQLFWEVDRRYWHRHQLKPGITGLAQVRGFRGATIQTSDLTNRLQADMEYVQGWDIWRDIGVLLRTFEVLVHKNAF